MQRDMVNKPGAICRHSAEDRSRRKEHKTDQKTHRPSGTNFDSRGPAQAGRFVNP